MRTATVRIKNLSLETIVGTNDWERKNRQEVIVNITFDIDASRAVQSDELDDTCNYRSLTKKIIKAVEESDFFLLEKLTDHILKIVMVDEKVLKATVEVDKPKALTHSDSVSIAMSDSR